MVLPSVVEEVTVKDPFSCMHSPQCLPPVTYSLCLFTYPEQQTHTFKLRVLLDGFVKSSQTAFQMQLPLLVVSGSDELP